MNRWRGFCEHWGSYELKIDIAVSFTLYFTFLTIISHILNTSKLKNFSNLHKNV